MQECFANFVSREQRSERANEDREKRSTIDRNVLEVEVYDAVKRKGTHRTG